MPGLALSTDGFKLSALPKPADLHKHNSAAQAVEFELPASVQLEHFEEHGDGNVHARLAGSTPLLKVGGKDVPIDLRLHELGYLYRLEDGANTLSLKARLDLRMPEKENAATDSGMMKLMAGLANAQAGKRSATTADVNLTDASLQSKRRKLDTTAHRRGLFGAQPASRSATGSPNMAPSRDRLALPTISVTPEDPLKKAKQEAIRTALIHLVAVRDVSKDYIVRTLACTASDVEPLLSRHCTPGLVPSKFRLNPKAYRLLDPYDFEYSEEDRKEVIEKAIENFDRSRLGPEEKVWQKLLPKSERGKGVCLSRLQKEREAVQAEKQEKLAAREARAAEDDGPSRPGSAGSMQSRKSTSKLEWSAGMQKRKEAAAKNDQEKAHNKPITKTLEKPAKKPAAPVSAVKASAKKATDKKPTQAPSGKIKSAEFITESDEEEVEAELKLTEPSPPPQPKSTTIKEPAAKKELAKPSRPAVPATKAVDAGPAAHKRIEKPTARAVDNPTAAKVSPAVHPKPASSSTSTASSLSRPTARPAALDKQKLSAKPATTSDPSSRPSTPKSGTMPLTVSKRPLVTKKITVPVTSTGSSSRATSATGKAASKVASKDTPKAVAKADSKDGIKDTSKTHAKTEKGSATKPAPARDTSQRPVAKRDPNQPPKKYEAEKIEPARKPVNGEAKAKPVASKPSVSKPGSASTNQDKPRVASASSKPATAPQTKKAEPVKAPAMQKTFSHQRKSSSPIKPSPLASSPPISASDIDEYRGSGKTSSSATPLKRPASTVAQKPNPKMPRREAPTSQPSKNAPDSERAPKRKVSEVDSSSTTHSAAASSTFERPAKRRDAGATVPRTTGASGSNAMSKSASTENNSLKAKPDERADSHSPSPASSTIGSTSTKGTSMSIMSNSGSLNKDTSKGKQVAKDTDKNGDRIKGFDRHDLDRAAKFEKDMEAYNKLQREVALMGDSAPLEKIRELNSRFNSLELTKRTLAMIAKSNC